MKNYKKQLDKIKIQLMLDTKTMFFTTILFLLKIDWTIKIPTLSVDGKTLFINPDFFMSLSEPEQVFCILHEIHHIALNHITRIRNRDIKRYNQAGDYVINEMLCQNGYSMPIGCLYNSEYKDLSTEQVYDKLKDNAPQEDLLGQDIKLTKNLKENQQIEAHIKNILCQAKTQTENSGIGTIPAYMKRIISKTLNPKLPWNIILAKYMSKYNKNDYTTKKFNKFFLPDFYLPTLYAPVISNLVIAIDASGSVSQSEFSSFINEVINIHQIYNPKKITLITFNTKIIDIITITHNINILKNFKFKGYGGTNLQDVYNWINKNTPEVVLLFSDGKFYHKPKPKTDMIFIIHNNLSFKSSYGKVIHYKLE